MSRRILPNTKVVDLGGALGWSAALRLDFGMHVVGTFIATHRGVFSVAKDQADAFRCRVRLAREFGIARGRNPVLTLRSIIDRYRLFLEIAQSERVVIEMYGDDNARKVYQIFKSPHPLCPVLGRKSWGAALLHLPSVPNNFMKGGIYAQARRKYGRAVKSGFSFGQFDSALYIRSMLEINRSASVRQGKPMPERFVSLRAVEDFCAQAPLLSGVFDDSGRLHAYAHPLKVGDVLIFSRLLGHTASLKLGVMYLLVVETIKQAFAQYEEHGHPIWANYDMFWGAGPGLRQFKRELGFKPHRVMWRWREVASSSCPPE